MNQLVQNNTQAEYYWFSARLCSSQQLRGKIKTIIFAVLAEGDGWSELDDEFIKILGIEVAKPNIVGWVDVIDFSAGVFLYSFNDLDHD